MGELGNRGGGNVGGGNGRMSKYNGNSSRLVQDSDFSNFSIKDAINRPSQFTYFWGLAIVIEFAARLYFLFFDDYLQLFLIKNRGTILEKKWTKKMSDAE